MCISIEISDHHRSFLLELAAKRGMRGYSEIIEEALDEYIANQTEQMGIKEKVLAMKGSRQKEEMEQMKSRLLELRDKWEAR